MFYGIKFYCINVIKNNILTLYQVSRPLGHNILLHSKTGFVLPKTPLFSFIRGNCNDNNTCKNCVIPSESHTVASLVHTVISPTPEAD